MARRHDRYKVPSPNALQQFGNFVAYSLGGLMCTTTIAMVIHALLGLTIKIGIPLFTWDMLNDALKQAMMYVCTPISLCMGFCLRDDREDHQK